jgi:integrase/recombinase XerD
VSSPETGEIISSPTILGSEARSHAKRRRRLNQADKPEVEGLKLGRYPFAAASEAYMGRRYGIVAPTTFKEEKRKYQYLGRVFEDLKKMGRVRTTDPRHIDRHDIQEFLAWMRAQHIDVSAQEKYLQLVNGLLRFFKNHTIDDMKAERVRLPKAGKKPIRVISENDREAIFSTLETMPKWRGSVARGMLAIYYGTGVRPSELRLAHNTDLDIVKETFFVRHPKGEGSWASPEVVQIIREDMLPFIRCYVKEREEYLKEKGVNATALFPSLDQRGNGFYSANGFQEIKAKVEELSGVSFKLKDFRSTLTTVTLDENPGMLVQVSAQLRHSSPDTTQRSYNRGQRSVAGKQLKQALKGRGLLTHDTPLIDSKFEITGYS